MGRADYFRFADQDNDGSSWGEVMIASNIVGPVFAGVALLAAFTSSVETVNELTTPSIIEGAGVVAGPVQAGGVTLVTWSITKRTDCPGLTSRVWHGEGGFQLTEQAQVTALVASEVPREYEIQTYIPELAPAGELMLEVTGYFDCGDGKKPFTIGPVVMDVVP